MHRSRAFTLIELLVVVAIIGILSAVVLASLSGAKNQGNDTGVKAEIGTIATQAVLYYGIGNTYGVTNYGVTSGAYCGQRPDSGNTVFFDANTTIDNPTVNAVTNMQKDAYGGVAGNNFICRSDPQRFLVTAELSNQHWYCADYTMTLTGPIELATKPAGIVCQ